MLKPTLMAAVPVRTAHSGSAVSHRPWGGNSTFKQIMILPKIFSSDKIYL